MRTDIRQIAVRSDLSSHDVNSKLVSLKDCLSFGDAAKAVGDDALQANSKQKTRKTDTTQIVFIVVSGIVRDEA